jgi:hypothetical protein
VFQITGSLYNAKENRKTKSMAQKKGETFESPF